MSNSLNKTDLVTNVTESLAADGLELSKTKVSAVVERTLELITGAVASGLEVSLRGFGVFKTRTSKARNGRNPRSGEALVIGAKKVMVFKAPKSAAKAA